jgi:RNA polymerase sigma factor for flagellar operon FliA
MTEHPPSSVPATEAEFKILPSTFANQDHSQQQRNELVVENLSLVELVMRQLLGRNASSTEAADIWSAGVTGLVDAARKYDGSRQARFRTYAEFRVRGAMLDYMRSLTWGPRSVYGRRRKLAEARSTFESRTGRRATTSELADEMGLSLAEQHALLMDVTRLRFCGIDGISSDRFSLAAPAAPGQEHDPHRQLEQKEVVAILRRALDRLPERHRRLLWLYYFEDLTMKVVGALLNVNEARVSQLHSKALAALRREMKEAMRPGDACQQKPVAIADHRVRLQPRASRKQPPARSEDSPRRLSCA